MLSKLLTSSTVSSSPTTTTSPTVGLGSNHGDSAAVVAVAAAAATVATTSSVVPTPISTAVKQVGESASVTTAVPRPAPQTSTWMDQCPRPEAPEGSSAPAPTFVTAEGGGLPNIVVEDGIYTFHTSLM